jgi:hypothetical protein
MEKNMNLIVGIGNRFEEDEIMHLRELRSGETEKGISQIKNANYHMIHIWSTHEK